MMKHWLCVVVAGAVLCINSATAQSKPEGRQTAAMKAGSASSAVQPVTQATEVLKKPAVFQGQLGNQSIQVAIRPKEVEEDGLEGEYFIFGHSHKILLAGEIDAEKLFLEESENGTNISGQWEGKLEGESLRGTWMSADGSVSKPFELKLIRLQPVAAKTAASGKIPAAGAASPPGR